MSSYLLGGGSTTLTVAYDRKDEAASYDLYAREHAAGTYGTDSLRERSGYEADLFTKVSAAEATLSSNLGSGELVVFLSPLGAYDNAAIEAWQSIQQWDLQEDDNGVTQAVRHGVDPEHPEYLQTLANLRTRISDTTADDGVDRADNVSGLSKIYQDMGAYGDLMPEDGDRGTFKPSPPLPVQEWWSQDRWSARAGSWCATAAYSWT